MKQPENLEGPKATENFEEGMKALFNVSKYKVVKAEKKRKGKAFFPRSECTKTTSCRRTRGASLFLTLPQRDGIALLRTGTSLLTS